MYMYNVLILFFYACVADRCAFICIKNENVTIVEFKADLPCASTVDWMVVCPLVSTAPNPSTIYIEIYSPSVMLFGGRAFGKWLGYQADPSSVGLMPL